MGGRGGHTVSHLGPQKTQLPSHHCQGSLLLARSCFSPRKFLSSGGQTPTQQPVPVNPGPATALPPLSPPPPLGAGPLSFRGAGQPRRRRAPPHSAPAGRPPCLCPGLRGGGSCCSLPFCSLAPEKTNLLLRSDSAAAPCLRPARADVSRSSPRRSIGPAGREAPAQQALAARHRGPGVSQQRPARAAPLGRRQH